MATHEFLVSRDVVFHETLFPFYEQNSGGAQREHESHELAKHEFFGQSGPHDEDPMENGSHGLL